MLLYFAKIAFYIGAEVTLNFFLKKVLWERRLRVIKNILKENLFGIVD